MADQRAILVLDDLGKLIGVVSDAVLLRCLLPAYIQVNEPLASVLDEHAAEELYDRVKNRTIIEMIGDVRELPQVASDDSLIEVAAAMLRTASPIVAVVEEGKIIGGISVKDLLYQLAR